jgi:hypothetical protein
MTVDASVDSGSSSGGGSGSGSGADSGSGSGGGSDGAAHDSGAATDASIDVATADSGGWTPSSLGSKLAFWLDPTSIVNAAGSVATWRDLSSHGNDATQGTAAYQPAYSASGIAGLPSVTFGTVISVLLIADSSSMQWGTSDFAIFAVFRAAPQNLAPEAMLYQKPQGTAPYTGAALYLNSDKPSTSTLATAQLQEDVYVDNSPPPSTFDDSSVHLLAAIRTGTTLAIRVDGALSASTAVSALDISAPGNQAAIGGQVGSAIAGDKQFTGDIAEVLGVDATLSSTDLGNVEGYLKARYGIP